MNHVVGIFMLASSAAIRHRPTKEQLKDESVNGNARELEISR